VFLWKESGIREGAIFGYGEFYPGSVYLVVEREITLGHHQD